MSKIQNKFSELKSKKEKALIAYIMVGFPNETGTMSAIRGLIKGGADIIELGFPFSDPIADGPVIQNASTISLSKGTKLQQLFQHHYRVMGKMFQWHLILLPRKQLQHQVIFC